MRIWIVLTVLMFTVGRGNDIFNIVEDLFEKTDRTFNDISFNVPAVIATVLGTSVVAEVIFGQTCPSLPLFNKTIAAPRWDNDNTGRNVHDNNAFNMMEFSEESGARQFDNIAICGIASPQDFRACLPQLTDIDYCLLKLIFTSTITYSNK